CSQPNLQIGPARQIRAGERDLPEAVERAVNQQRADRNQYGHVLERGTAGPDGEIEDSRGDPDWNDGKGEERFAHRGEGPSRAVTRKIQWDGSAMGSANTARAPITAKKSKTRLATRNGTLGSYHRWRE